MLTKKGKQKKLAKQQQKIEKRKLKKELQSPKPPKNKGIRQRLLIGSHVVPMRGMFQTRSASWINMIGRYYAESRSDTESILLHVFKPIKTHIKFKIDWRKEGF